MRSLSVVGVLVVSAVFAPLFLIGAGEWLYSPEMINPLLRTKLLAQQFWEQGGYPRMIPELAGGGGYPVFNFYAPGSMIPAMPLVWAGVHPADALKVVIFGSAGLCFFSVYWLSRQHFGRLGGILSGCMVLGSVFLASTLYIHGMYSQTIATLLAPVVIAAFAYTLQMPATPIFGLAFFGMVYGGFVLVHTISSMIYTPVFLGAALALLWYHKKWRSHWKVLLGIPMGLGISCGFWLPALAEKQFVHHEILTTGFVNFRRLFVRNPFFGDAGEVFNHDPAGLHLGIPLVVCCILLLFAYGLALAMQRWDRRAILSTIFGLGGMALVFMSTSLSQPLWETLPLLGYVQAPGRFIGPAVLLLSLACGFVALHGISKPLHVALVTGGLCLIVFHFGTPDWRTIKPMSALVTDPYTGLGDPEKEFHQVGYGEFLPRDVPRDVRIDPGGPLVRVASTAAEVQHSQMEGVNLQAVVQVHEPAAITLRPFSFPGWEVFVDGKIVEQPATDAHGRLVVSLTPGLRTIEARFSNTTIRDIAEAISVIAFLPTAALLLFFAMFTMLQSVSSRSIWAKTLLQSIPFVIT